MNNNNFNAVNLPYGNCLIPSNQYKRDYITSANFGESDDPCLYTSNVNLAPSIYPKPSLNDIAKTNTSSVSKLDNYFFSNNSRKKLEN
jgi:hypothetical protein